MPQGFPYNTGTTGVRDLQHRQLPQHLKKLSRQTGIVSRVCPGNTGGGTKNRTFRQYRNGTGMEYCPSHDG